MNQRNQFRWAAAVVVALAAAQPAAAQFIISPTGGVVNAGGTSNGPLDYTFDQSGLSVGFTSGVTNFASYIAGGPTHTNIFGGFEWFSDAGTTSASVTYDLGVIWSITALALWNEESSGIGYLDLWYSTDGVTFSALALGLLPTDNPLGPDYLADVFGFGAVSARYVRFDMSDCPQIDPGSYPACAIGEVAFQTGQVVTAVPEPATMGLMATGLIGLTLVARRRRNRTGKTE